MIYKTKLFAILQHEMKCNCYGILAIIRFGIITSDYIFQIVYFWHNKLFCVNKLHRKLHSDKISVLWQNISIITTAFAIICSFRNGIYALIIQMNYLLLEQRAIGKVSNGWLRGSFWCFWLAYFSTVNNRCYLEFCSGMNKEKNPPCKTFRLSWVACFPCHRCAN